MKQISVSAMPWYEIYTENIENHEIWEDALKKSGYNTFKLTKKEIKEFIDLNPNLTKFEFGLDRWFNAEHIGTQEFFKLFRAKQIYYRRVVTFSQSQKEWLKSKFEGKICIFNEMHPIDEDVFNELGITYINFFMPPIRFTKISKIQSVYSNCPKIREKLIKYQYPNFLYSFFSKWLFFTKINSIIKLNKKIKIELNSCLIVGQCRFDYSKYDFDKQKFVQLSDYVDELKNITRKYNKVYYTKHPHEKECYERDLLEGLGIEILDDIDSYSLMLSKNIKGVCALSSSMLTEARYFGKNEHRLFTNFVDMNKFINVTRNFIRSKMFWKKILN